MSLNDERQLNVITPENVLLQLQTAGLGSRSGAHIIDSLILIGVNLVFGLAVWGISVLWHQNQRVLEYVMAGVIIFVLVVNFGYFLLMEFYRDGQTIGKRIVGLRVVQDNGQPLTFLSAAIRTFFRIIDFLPFYYFLGILVSFFHPQNKRIGDMVAGTVLVYDSNKERVSTQQRVDKEIEKLRKDLPAIIIGDEVRQTITREDWQMLSNFIERISTLSKAKNEEFGHQMVDYLGKKLGLKIENTYYQKPVAFLAAVYLILRKDWSV